MSNFFAFNQHMFAPMRITASSAMLIDHMYTSNVNLSSIMVCDISHADRFVAVGTIALHGITENVAHNYRLTSFQSFRKLNVEKLLADLFEFTFNIRSESSDINTMITIFIDFSLSTWNKHAPIITRRCRQRSTPWITEEVLHCCHKRNSAYHIFLCDWSSTSQMIYKQIRDEASCLTRAAKRKFFLKRCKTGPKSFRKHIKTCTGYDKIHFFLHPRPDANPS